MRELTEDDYEVIMDKLSGSRQGPAFVVQDVVGDQPTDEELGKIIDHMEQQHNFGQCAECSCWFDGKRDDYMCSDCREDEADDEE